MCPPPPSLELMATAHRFAVLTLYSPILNTQYTKDSIFYFALNKNNVLVSPIILVAFCIAPV